MRGPTQAAQKKGFTLIELLVVIAIIAILAAMLLPALASAKKRAQKIACLNNCKQVSTAMLVYLSEFDDTFPDQGIWIGLRAGAGVLNSASSAANIDSAALIDPAISPLAYVVKQANIYKCPGDIYNAANGPRVRSISSNGVLGGKPTVTTTAGQHNYYGSGGSAGVATKMSQLDKPGASRVWATLDEHWDGISDAAFMLDVGMAQTAEHWRDLPATYHGNISNLSFLDGHAEGHKWVGKTWDNPTYYPVKLDSTSTPWWTGGGPTFTVSPDYEWMRDGMPYAN